MKKVLVTGSRGFIGKNLLEGLRRTTDVSVETFDRGDRAGTLEAALRSADVVYHLAGVNRPKDEREFADVNTGLTQEIAAVLGRLGRSPLIVFASSTQAEQDNPYGKSKKAAEDALISFGEGAGAAIAVYRLPGVFGKWSRPNYNTVVATFCHNIARGREITISDPEKEIELVYIDDVVRSFIGHLDDDGANTGVRFHAVDRAFKVTLGDLAKKIYDLRDIRQTLKIPDLSDDFMRYLHATYISFLDINDFSYALDVKTDDRGFLFELIKSDHCGQIFLSKTHKGITRGNHYHDSKIEKFCVIQGKAVVRFRNVLNDEVLEYHVSDEKIEVVDIPPGYTHNIENVSDSEMIVLFWANRIFDLQNPDTYFQEV